MKTSTDTLVQRTQGEWEVWEDYDLHKNPCFSIRGERGNKVVATTHEIDQVFASKTALENARFICKAVNEHDKLKAINDSLLNALKDIEKEASHLDAGVNKYGDLQISKIWLMARDAAKKAEQ